MTTNSPNVWSRQGISSALNQINSIIELNPNGYSWSSCPHLYSTNGESHVTISDGAIKVAQTTMNLVLLLSVPGDDTCGKVRNF